LDITISQAGIQGNMLDITICQADIQVTCWI
jgi:hypothetical protein